MLSKHENALVNNKRNRKKTTHCVKSMGKNDLKIIKKKKSVYCAWNYEKILINYLYFSVVRQGD